MADNVIVRFTDEGLESMATDLQKVTASSKALDSSVESVNDEFSMLAKAIEQSKEKLKGIKAGSKEFNALSNEIKATEISLKSMQKGTTSLRTELKTMIDTTALLGRQMKELEKNGLQGTKAYKTLSDQFKASKAQVGALKDEIGDLNDETSQLGSDTRGLDLGIRGLTQIGAAFQIAEGASALFGSESKKLEETLIRLNGIMAITNGLQQIQEELLKKDSIAFRIASKAQALYTAVVGTSTGAMRIFKLVLASTGIGLLVVAIGALVANFGRIKETLSNLFPQFSNLGKKFDDLKEKSIGLVKNGLLQVTNGFIDAYNNSLLLRLAIQSIAINFKNTVTTLTAGAKLIANPFRAIFKAIKAGIDGDFNGAINALKEGVFNVPKIFKEAGGDIVDNFSDGIKNAKLSRLEKITIDELFPPKKEVKEDGENLVKDVLSPLELLKNRITELKKEIENALFQNVESGIITGLTKELKDLELQLNKLEQLKNLILSDEQAVIEPIIEPIITPKFNIDGGLKSIDGINKATDEIPTKLESALEKSADFLSEYFNIQRENYESNAQYFLAVTGAYFQGIQDLATKTFDFINLVSQISRDKQLADLDEKRSKGLISEKQYQKELAKSKNEQAKRDKRGAIMQASLNIPIAISSAFAGTSGGIVVKSIASAIAGITAIANLASVIAKPVPKYRKGGEVLTGILKGKSHEQGGIPIEAEGGEYIFSKRKTIKNYSLLKSIDKGTFSMNNIKPHNIPFAKEVKTINYKSEFNELSEELKLMNGYIYKGNKERILQGEKINKLLTKTAGRV